MFLYHTAPPNTCQPKNQLVSRYSHVSQRFFVRDASADKSQIFRKALWKKPAHLDTFQFGGHSLSRWQTEFRTPPDVRPPGGYRRGKAAISSTPQAWISSGAAGYRSLDSNPFSLPNDREIIYPGISGERYPPLADDIGALRRRYLPAADDIRPVAGPGRGGRKAWAWETRSPKRSGWQKLWLHIY